MARERVSKWEADRPVRALCNSQGREGGALDQEGSSDDGVRCLGFADELALGKKGAKRIPIFFSLSN